jgi:succinate-semialdehyde dehydrogenase/glutarate-semialdehyde dehydrogenase
MATAAIRTDSLVAAARAAQEQWVRRSLAERASVLRDAVRVVRLHADEIAATVMTETGKPRTEAISNELFAAADHAQWLSRNVEHVLRDEALPVTQLHLKTKRATLLYEPLGVVGAITPWNVPFAIPFGVVATAVAAGNGVVLKPSEHTPQSADWVARVLEEAGAPRGLVQVAPSDREAGEAVVAERGIAKIFFTGSVAVGRKVAAAAGARGCPVVLELGGRDAFVVFADADIDRAVEGAAFASFLNSGQACVSAERIYVGSRRSRRRSTSRRSCSRRSTAGPRSSTGRCRTRSCSHPSSRSSRSTERTTLFARRTTRRSASARACGRATRGGPSAWAGGSRRGWCG